MRKLVLNRPRSAEMSFNRPEGQTVKSSEICSSSSLQRVSDDPRSVKYTQEDATLLVVTLEGLYSEGAGALWEM